MEDRNLDRALDITSKLIMGEEISRDSNIALYEEYNANGQVYAYVHAVLKKMNLDIYEYNYGLYVSPGENNRIFGYSNEELRRELGLKVNKELFLCYYIIYNIIMEFYTDTTTYNYVEFVKIEDVIATVDGSVGSIVDLSKGIVADEVEENSFKQVALMWNDLQAVTAEDVSGVRAARNSKSGYVKIVFNFLEEQRLFTQVEGRYYPTDRFKAIIENYFDNYKGRIYEILKGKEED
ncbi:MAG: DUF6063 family protein [Alistipes sp.]|nr:DUF6063 family protein [Alistipes sp.]